MRVLVMLTVDVNWCDEDLGPVKEGDPLCGRVESSVAEAVHNAMLYAQGEGHRHDMEDLISVELITSGVGGVTAKMLFLSPFLETSQQ